MEVKLSEEKGFTVLSLDGNFDTASAAEKESEFMDAIGDGTGRYLVDFTGVPYIASSGLRILLKIAQAAKAGKGELSLCSLNSTVREVFEISGFDKIINTVENRDKALGG